MTAARHNISISIDKELDDDINYLVRTTPNLRRYAKNKSRLIEKILRGTVPRRN